MGTALQQLSELGQSAWLDGIDRGDFLDGGLVGMAGRGVCGLAMGVVTHQKRPEQVEELLRRVCDPKEVYLELAVADARTACATLEGAVTEPGLRDCWVSLGVDPRFAHDVRAMVEEAYQLQMAVGHPRFYVEIPATVQGLTAIEEATAIGVRVNVTMLSSIYRHRQAAEAYLRGLRRFRDGGGDLRGISSVASVSVSRLAAAGDEALRAVGGDVELAGRLGVANAKMAYRTFRNVFSGMGWEELARAGGTPQWCAWVSGSREDPAITDVKYVEQLIGPETIASMSRQTIEAFIDHGRVAPTLETGLEEAGAVLDEFRRAGVDYDALTSHLQKVQIRDSCGAMGKALAKFEMTRSHS